MLLQPGRFWVGSGRVGLDGRAASGGVFNPASDARRGGRVQALRITLLENPLFCTLWQNRTSDTFDAKLQCPN